MGQLRPLLFICHQKAFLNNDLQTGHSIETIPHLWQVVFALWAYLSTREGVLGRCHHLPLGSIKRRGYHHHAVNCRHDEELICCCALICKKITNAKEIKEVRPLSKVRRLGTNFRKIFESKSRNWNRNLWIKRGINWNEDPGWDWNSGPDQFRVPLSLL